MHYNLAMIIELIVEIQSDRRLHFEVPSDWPIGKARATLTLLREEEPKKPTAGKWVNPLLGLARTKGAKLTLEQFMKMQQAEVALEIENDQRLWENK